MTNLESEYARDAYREAIHMLKENAKGLPAMFLEHPAYLEVIEFAEAKLAESLKTPGCKTGLGKACSVRRGR